VPDAVGIGLSRGHGRPRPCCRVVTGLECADLGRDARLARPFVEERTSGPLVPTLRTEVETHFLLLQPVNRRGFCMVPA
jgi:hypothetical protein